MKIKKTWKEKLVNSKDLPKVEPIKPEHRNRWGTGTMAIPSPLEVDALMKQVPEGKVTTINKLREKIARAHHATMGCPITTGIFSWIAANAAEEDAEAGRKFTPYWRTLKEGGVINEKYPGGIEKQVRLLQEEGHTIIQKGKRWVVEDWENSII